MRVYNVASGGSKPCRLRVSAAARARSSASASAASSLSRRSRRNPASFRARYPRVYRSPGPPPNRPFPSLTHAPLSGFRRAFGGRRCGECREEDVASVKRVLWYTMSRHSDGAEQGRSGRPALPLNDQRLVALELVELLTGHVGAAVHLHAGAYTRSHFSST